MRRESHVRFGGRAGETGQPRGWNRTPVRPYLHGPVVAGHKVYLFAFIDDFSRAFTG